MESRAGGARAKPTLGTIVREYRHNKLAEEMRGNWANVLLHRLPSFALVWSCARLGITPIAVSLASIVVALAMPAMALVLPVWPAAIAVCAAGFLFQVLDCTDGALARTTGQVSAIGGTLDFLIDMVQWGLLYLAIGILADRYLGTGGFWSALAILAGWMRLYARMARDAMTPVPDGEKRFATVFPREPGEAIVAVIAGLSGLIPFLALVTPDPVLARAAVIFLVVYSVLDLGDTAIGIASAWRKGRGKAR
ncbi:CDP-alcohol phosphatidyltransferase family protein [Stappia sp. F7233]|uniref:CDP-alcohol phosphatidyltransferase family protein n=1 Tax=Stappia albiluteola TaxID=2758565 RepID=A0A839AHX1_9HYPH|nr:CDP-alcohol phosphatidyltransferase family protein [Stappia albiluteola]MBA5778735.1 CDP-alcohol phosphatidyltransferase family protein [Stappia albiluteola]